MKTIAEEQNDYVSPKSKVIEIQIGNAILSGSVPGSDGIMVTEDDNEY